MGYGPRSGNGAGASEGVQPVDAYAFPRTAIPRGLRPAAPALSGGMLVALAMNRRARGLRGLDVLRRSQDRAPPRTS
jgi:hypothetical protein